MKHEPSNPKAFPSNVDAKRRDPARKGDPETPDEDGAGRQECLPTQQGQSRSEGLLFLRSCLMLSGFL